MEAPTVALVLVREVFSRFLLPETMIPDNGANLVGKVMTSVMTMLGVKRKTTSPYHAQANGLVERANAIIQDILAIYNFDEVDCDLHLPLCLAAIRTSTNVVTGTSPFWTFVRLNTQASS